MTAPTTPTLEEHGLSLTAELEAKAWQSTRRGFRHSDHICWRAAMFIREAAPSLRRLATVEAELARIRAELVTGLALVDYAVKSCPLTFTHVRTTRCFKCGATASQNCGPKATALDALARCAREALGAKP